MVWNEFLHGLSFQVFCRFALSLLSLLYPNQAQLAHLMRFKTVHTHTVL